MDNNGFLMVILGILAAWAAVVILWLILQIIANWRIFTKAGEAGWKSLIPFYADYITYKISWTKGAKFFWIGLAASIVVFFADFFGGEDGGALFTLLSVAGSLVAMVLGIMLSYKKSKAFGHGIGFAIGLLFLSPIFTLILGFGASAYRGPQD